MRYEFGHVVHTGRQDLTVLNLALVTLRNENLSRNVSKSLPGNRMSEDVYHRRVVMFV